MAHCEVPEDPGSTGSLPRDVKIVAASTLLLLALAGCSAPGDASEPAVASQDVSPGAALYKSLRAGSFNLGAAQESLREAFGQAESLRDAQLAGSDLRNALAELADLLDSAGATLVDHALPPPPQSEVDADFAHFDEARLKAIEATNDALHDLREARGIAEGLYEEVPGLRTPLDHLASLHSVAEEDLLSALESLGGKDETAG